jgi:hypothetical protein
VRCQEASKNHRRSHVNNEFKSLRRKHDNATASGALTNVGAKVLDTKILLRV